MNKYFTLLFILVLVTFMGKAQNFKVDTATFFGVTPKLSKLQTQLTPRKKAHTINNKMRRNPHKFKNFVLKSAPQSIQLTQGIFPNEGTIHAWLGINNENQNVFPPDPSGAAGPNHYVQMVNLAMQIYDKSGNTLWGPSSLSNVFPGSAADGDPIVLYDKFADRWMITQFQKSNNAILIAVSTTQDPTNSWYYYTFEFEDFPDYPKYGIWKNALVMTANMAQNHLVFFERDSMLIGSPNARKISTSLPQLQRNGFFSALPGNYAGEILSDAPNEIPVFYFEDDGWTGDQDVLKVWEATINWNTPQNSNVQLKATLPVFAFDSEFTEPWYDIPQKGTTQRLDAVPGALMNMAHIQKIGNEFALALCHSVDVDPSENIRSGIRWYELRKHNSTWSIKQQSTYAPDDNLSRFMGSIALDSDGNIALAYAISGDTLYPSLAFTGRRFSDGLNEMYLQEYLAFKGTGFQGGTNRYGDYFQLTLDPIEANTFWFTGEFLQPNVWQTGIFNFKLYPSKNNDIGISAILQPQDGILNQENLTVTIKNYGLNTQSNFQISAIINQTNLNYTYTKNLLPGTIDTIQFEELIDMSNEGLHTVKVFTQLNDDEFNGNDTLSKTILNYFSKDVGILQLLSPSQTQGFSSSETITIELFNYGKDTLFNFPITLIINDTIVVQEIFQDTILSRTAQVLTFEYQANLSLIGTYTLQFYTSLINDGNLVNDTLKVTLISTYCTPISNCIFGDAMIFFGLNEIQNASDCGLNGYQDFRQLNTTLIAGKSYPLTVQTEEYLQSISVWIDFNQNNYYEVNELILTNHQFDYQTTVPISIPLDAPFGTFQLRIRNNFDSNSNDPCAAFAFGETEDYTVTIDQDVNSLTIEHPQHLYYNATGSLIHYQHITISNQLTYEIYNAIGQLVQGGLITQENGTIPVGNFTKGMYILRLNPIQNNGYLKFIVE